MKRTTMSMALAALAMVAVWTAAHAQRSSTVANVGGRIVTRDEYEREAKKAVEEFTRQRGTPSPEIEKLIKRQALERLIRGELLTLEAKRRAIPVSEAEIEAEFRTHPFFNRNGSFDAALFAKVKAANSAEYRATRAQIREEIQTRKLGDRIRAEVTPDPAQIRRDVERAQSRATVDVLALRPGEFDPVRVEPTEAQVLAYYRAHERDFARVARAEISVIQVGEGVADRDRVSADSLLGEIRNGLTFEGAAAGQGGVRSRVLVSEREWPAWWPAESGMRATLLGTGSERPSPGAVITDPQRGRDGWLIVRVDAIHPAGVAPLRDVAREIRHVLREQADAEVGRSDQRAIYEQRRSMLRTTAYRARYAWIDTARIDPGTPTTSDLEEYYRGHLADFSAYDPATATIRTRPLAEVRDPVTAQWRRDRRGMLARETAARIETAWRRNRRDRNSENRATWVRESGPFPLGAPVDTGRVARVVGDSVAARAGALGVGVAALPGGIAVFHLHQKQADYTPTFEEYLPVVRREQQAAREARDAQGAQAYYERDPSRWAGGRAVHYHEVLVPLPDLLDVPLTRTEVEKYHLEHIDKYAAGEQVRASHVLVSPATETALADAVARKEAEGLLERLRKGEDFAELARRYSDDPPTQKQGGDLGFFGRGVMLDPVERAAFGLKVGELSGIVHTQSGYHILKVTDRLPAVGEPLKYVYTNVASDAAAEKAQRIVQRTADSLIASTRGANGMLAAARKLKLEHGPRVVNLRDFDAMPQEMRPFLREIESATPRVPLRRARPLKGVGASIAWLDSIGPADSPSFDQVRDRVIDEYLHVQRLGALYRKRAELDSLFAAGWSVDSVATLWGGFERVTDVAAGKGIVGLGGAARVDSLLFGGAKPAGLDAGETSAWVELTRGLARVRLVEMKMPAADQLAARLESQRRLAVERELQQRFDRMARDFSVRIVDPEMRDVVLPPLPDAPPEATRAR